MFGEDVFSVFESGEKAARETSDKGNVQEKRGQKRRADTDEKATRLVSTQLLYK